MPLDRNGLEILSRRECMDLLRSRPIGRVAVTRNALPAILPVNYWMDGEDVVFATGTGSKSLAVDRASVIAFEADEFDADSRSGWSVLVVGLARPVDPSNRRWAEVRAASRGSWVGNHASRLVRLPTDKVSGRRVVGAVVATPVFTPSS